jgi:beta-lactam-binding protein with PASTA domain
MPDLTGMTLPEATALVTASGLKTFSVTTAPTPTIAPTSVFVPAATPTVIFQTPPAGSRVTPGTLVSFQVARS